MTVMADFLASCPAPVAHDEQTWPVYGGIRLRFAAYLHPVSPPLDLVTSVRAIVQHGAYVVVVHDAAFTHVCPGGRREAGEAPEAALRRELLEETGLAINPPVLLGFVHLQHQTPRAPDYPFPYPDMAHLIYHATPADPDPVVRPGPGELRADFRTFAAALALLGEEIQRAFLLAVWPRA